MILKFKTYQLKEGTKMYKDMVEKTNQPNDFIIVGEEMLGSLDCYKAHQIDDRGICFIGGLKIDEFALFIEKKDLKLKDGLGCEIQEFDIPKKYLTMDIIENIQRLNS
jgi:hypothetical protein